MMAGKITGLCLCASPEAVEGIPVFRQRRGGAMGSEEQEQIALFEWASMLEGRYPALSTAYHIPNGGKRGKVEAARLKAAGVRAGVPDIHLPHAAGGFIGLYIELKVTGNRAEDAQKKWLKRLCAEGHFTCICYGWIAAAEIIELYLQGKITR